MRNWQVEAPLYIEGATGHLSAGATLAERRAALNKVAYEFHGGTSWGKKTWSKHVRRYLEQHGLAPLHVQPVGHPSAQHIKFASADFPFRSTS